MALYDDPDMTPWHPLVDALYKANRRAAIASASRAIVAAHRARGRRVDAGYGNAFYPTWRDRIWYRVVLERGEARDDGRFAWRVEFVDDSDGIVTVMGRFARYHDTLEALHGMMAKTYIEHHPDLDQLHCSPFFAAGVTQDQTSAIVAQLRALPDHATLCVDRDARVCAEPPEDGIDPERMLSIVRPPRSSQRDHTRCYEAVVIALIRSPYDHVAP